MNSVITVGRQYGSCGREIGKRLACELGVAFYDKEKLKEVAVKMGAEDLMLEAYGEKHAKSLLHSLAIGAYSFGYHEASHQNPFSQKAYLLAFDVIKRVARQGPCVIVGRCADYVLEHDAQCVNLFFHAPLPVRIKTIARRMKEDEAQAEERIRTVDRLRRNYYNYYTNKIWGEMDSYHFAVDSSVYGVEATARMLSQMLCVGEGIPTGNYSGSRN